MDIVDAQFHINKVGIRNSIAAMDALGIQEALFHEHEGRDADRNHTPHHVIENGFVRPVGFQGEVASRRYPDRLSYLWQIDPRDPDLDAVVRLVRSSPYVRALRICMSNPTELELLASGGCRPAFAVAHKYGFPLFVLTNRRAPLVRPYLEEFTESTIILDHCGLPPTPDAFEDVLSLARFRNLALKWCHPMMCFPTAGYPFPEWDPYLKAAADRFGPERIMWASDFTEHRGVYTWAEALFYILSTPVLSATDKEWVLGRTVRTLLNWPKRELEPGTPRA